MSLFEGAHGPWLVAEIGGNHEGDFDYAVRLTDLAIEAGADAIKFQIYTGDTLVSQVADPGRHAHFRRFELTPDQHLALAGRVLAAGRAYVASVWDPVAFGWITPVLSACKVGSGDVTAVPLLRAAARTGKPLMLSTGLSRWDEVTWAVEQIRSYNAAYGDRDQLAVLQCTSMYPIPSSEAHLAVMLAYRTLGVTIGYSDHTIGHRALEVAAAMGAEVLEFHFTDRKEQRQFRDHQLSLERQDVQSLIRTLDEIRELQGSPAKQITPVEQAHDHVRSFRRAVYPSRDVAAGEVLEPGNLCVLRPNHGIDARAYDEVVGRRTRRAFRRHEPLDWGWLE